MKRWFKNVLLVMAIPLAVIVVTAGFLGYRVLSGGTTDDADHLKAKAAYLEQLSKISAGREPQSRPNILVIYYDDLGYGDLGFTGSKAIRTPNIDALAESGVVLTNYHSPSPVCSPSRAGLLTGRLPPRAGMPNVVFPTVSEAPLRDRLAGSGGVTRMAAEEITIADMLKAVGYNTGMVGKWHLGDQTPSLPNDFGFESFYGALYSNDMEPFAIWRNAEIEIEAPADQTRLDGLYTHEAVKFIAEASGQDEPFFLYFAHNFPHIPLFASKQNVGRSAAGLYGDVVEALDDGVGRIVAELERTGESDNTILILTSDNGPWYQGSPGQLRGRKGQTYEGGMRVPFLIHWPAGLEGGRTLDDVAMGTDVLPTFADWLDLPLPQDRTIDGRSLSKVLSGDQSNGDPLVYFYSGTELLAVSDGRFKYHKRQPFLYILSGFSFAMPMAKGPWMFDLSVDPDESYDVSMRYPDDAKRLKLAMEARDNEMKENPRGWK